MDEKIAKLTEIIYKEGVEKGEEERKTIIQKANQEASEIINEAQQKAKKIIDDAEHQAQEIQRNIKAEIKLSSQQTISSFKQQITDLLLFKSINENISPTLSDPELLRDLIILIIKNWNTQSTEKIDMEVLLPESKRLDLEKSFKNSTTKILSDNVKISFSNKVKGGFQIVPMNDSYKVSFTEEDFIEFFKEYLRPKSRSFLFDE